ncbi:MAG: methyl-accepting chemotaxis protein [Candidatus Zixiibacteriota bacterium]
MGSIRYASVRSKLVLLVGILFTGFVIYGYTAYRQSTKMQVNGPVYKSIVSSKDLIADILPPPEFIVESYLSVSQLADERNASAAPALIDKLTRLQSDFETRHEYWASALPDGSLKQLITVAAYQPAHEFFSCVTTELMPKVKAGRYTEARALFAGKLTNLYELHRSAIDRAVTDATDLNTAIEASARSEISGGQLILFAISLFSVLLTIAATFLISRLIVTPVRKLSAIAVKVADGEIDCTFENAPAESKDEIDQLSRSFKGLVDHMKELTAAAQRIAANDLTVKVVPKSERDLLGTSFKQMVANLSAMIRQLSENARELVSAASQIASNSEQMSNGANNQSNQVHEVSTAVEEMTATIIESSRNAGSASTAARNAAETATTGGQIVNESIQAMQKIAVTVRQSADSIAKLATSAKQIGEIIGVIDDIADQTNLLALNAAIEAARAGEQGRGFAVVADEVRKLAERTGKATGEITTMIKGIQKETSEAVHSMEAGIKVVDQGRELADQAGSSLTEIVAMAQRVTDMIQQMATAAEEQSVASEQIAKNVEHISGITKETATGAEQSAAAAEELSRQADGLQVMVSKFRL